MSVCYGPEGVHSLEEELSFNCSKLTRLASGVWTVVTFVTSKTSVSAQWSQRHIGTTF